MTPPAASGLSQYSTQVLGGLPGVNWTDLFAQLMGIGKQDSTLANLMMPTGSIPQLGPIMPKPRIPVSPAKAPAVAAPAAPVGPPMPLSFAAPGYMGVGGVGGFMPAGVGGDTGYGQMGMGVTGQGAFGSMGYSGVGYGDTY